MLLLNLSWQPKMLSDIARCHLGRKWCPVEDHCAIATPAKPQTKPWQDLQGRQILEVRSCQSQVLGKHLGFLQIPIRKHKTSLYNLKAINQQLNKNQYPSEGKSQNPESLWCITYSIQCTIKKLPAVQRHRKIGATVNQKSNNQHKQNLMWLRCWI